MVHPTLRSNLTSLDSLTNHNHVKHVIRNPLDSPLGLLTAILLVSLISLLSEEILQYLVAWRILELNLKMPLRLMKVLRF